MPHWGKSADCLSRELKMANWAFPCHAYAFTVGPRGKWEFPIMRWEEMHKVRLKYSAVCTKTARESVPLFSVETSAPLKSRCKPGCTHVSSHMPPGEMTAVIRARRRHRPRIWKNFCHKDHTLSVEWTRNHYALQIKQPCNITVTGICNFGPNSIFLSVWNFGLV